MKQLSLLMICLIALFLWTNFIRKSVYLTKVKSGIDNKEYMVRPLPDKQEAADRLATLNQSLRRLCDHCVTVSQGKDEEAIKDANRLSRNYKGERIIASCEESEQLDSAKKYIEFYQQATQDIIGASQLELLLLSKRRTILRNESK